MPGVQSKLRRTFCGVPRVLACGNQRTSRRSLYNGTGAPRLRWPLRRLAIASAVLAALANGGCAYRLGSLFERGDADVEQTGSVARTDNATPVAQAVPPSEVDLAYARAVAAEALARGGKD